MDRSKRKGVLLSIKEILESKEFQCFYQQQDISKKDSIVERSLLFLITTNIFDCEELINFINYSNKRYLLLASGEKDYLDPYLEKKGFSWTYRMKMGRENYLKNGFFYHGTALQNQESILNNGLLTLNDKYGNSYYDDCIQVSEAYNSINRLGKTNGNWSLFSHNTAISERRFNSVYLTPYVESALNYAKNANEYMRFFTQGLLNWLGFEGDVRSLNYENKEQIRTLIEQRMMDVDCLHMKEASIILNFFDKYYDIPANREEGKVLVLIPNDIKIAEPSIEELIQKYEMDGYINYDWFTVMKNYKYGELCSLGSIVPENTAILTINDKSLKLKI